MEKSARRINLDADITIVTSRQNDTGKSCVIKSLYYALGAEPINFHSEWKKIQPITILKFINDGADYCIMRKDRIVALFDGEMKLVRSFNGTGKELADFYVDFLNFKLKLVHSSNLESQTPFPSFYFLPYYIDQDAGWKANWCSFEHLSAFKKWRKDLVEYHTGIRPNKYYEEKAKKAIIQDQKSELDNELKVISKVYNRTISETKVTNLDVDINISDFKAEINELVASLSILSEKEDKYKNRLNKLFDEKILIEHQINIATETQKELRKDLEYAELQPSEIVCPTCGCVHKNSIEGRFSIAQDEDRCYQVILELQEKLFNINKKIEAEKESFKDYSEEKNNIESVLNREKEKIKFRDYVDSVGKKSFNVNLKKEMAQISSKINELKEKLDGIDKEMGIYNNPKHREGIVNYYIENMRRNLHSLDVQKLMETEYKSISCQIKENGSDLSRALLAYYYAILNTMAAYSSTIACPVVIDSPLQDEQDEQNIRRILEFIRDKKPSEMQLILGCVGMDGLEFKEDAVVLNGVEFKNANCLFLDNKYAALNKEEYPRLFEELKAYIDILILNEENDTFLETEKTRVKL